MFKDKKKKKVEQISVPTLTYCPRCSDPISYLHKEIRYSIDKHGNEKQHIYYYAVHYQGYDKNTKKVQLRRCYLGSDAYDYVERFNNLNLAGAIKQDRYKEYLQQLANRVDQDTIKDLLSRLQQKKS